VRGFDPSEQITEFEQTHLFLSFCSFVTLTNTKKLNLANVFILLLKKTTLRDLFKTYCDIKNDFNAIKFFLHFDSTLYKSKYVMKFLNLNKKKLFV
jgi:hypothetical protein